MNPLVQSSQVTVIAVDLGTTTTAVAVRFANDTTIHTFSPITGKEERQKTASDLHVFLDREDEKMTIDNSLLGNEIDEKFKDKKFHYHFQAYKMALYDQKQNQLGKNVGEIEFANEIKYPNKPTVMPICQKKEFKLSEIYILVVQHVRRAIENWFQKQGKFLDMDNTVWVCTVPAISGAKQKEFMRKIFTEGMGKINNKVIKDDQLICVLEPEGAFLYALMTNLAVIAEGETLNVVAIDVGGGTLDTTVASFRNGMEPEIKRSHFGSSVGGRDVDQAFLKDLQQITDFETFANKKGMSQGKQQFIMSNILSQFQQQKHEYFGQDEHQVQDKDFEIVIDELIMYPEQIELVKQNLQSDEWMYDPDIPEDERDVVFQQQSQNQFSLIFKVPFAIARYMDPIASAVNSKIRILVADAQKFNYKINLGFILGGFSFSKTLVDKVQAEFFDDFKIESFGNKSSLAIVMGATMFSRFNLQKRIPRNIGIETITMQQSLNDKEITEIKQNMPDLWCENGKQSYTQVGLKLLFKRGDILQTKDTWVQTTQKFCPALDTQKQCEFRMHYLPENQPETLPIIPITYCHTDLYYNTQKFRFYEQRGFIVDVPDAIMKLPLKQRIVTVVFRYEIQGEGISVLYKWQDPTQNEEVGQVSNMDEIPLEKRFYCPYRK